MNEHNSMYKPRRGGHCQDGDSSSISVLSMSDDDKSMFSFLSQVDRAPDVSELSNALKNVSLNYHEDSTIDESVEWHMVEESSSDEDEKSVYSLLKNIDKQGRTEELADDSLKHR
eukprot:CAMPEP_0194360390 /NCGR_PEP_ID=MMETSP0174-20130528/7721_1 /TAXON_ID=216777 /ORGANISM="Proboscia alata, Strain PI-D3" /LENGTH=114 /DNA_ID=CAMNT_0039131847 /DNA_START=303 /DNA_END=648 /DNA_ORIENTATION=-